MTDMTETRPPALATWLLKHVARENDALIGDLLEEYRRRRSVVWYWRQVLTTAAVCLSREALLVLGVMVLFVIASQFSIPGAHADKATLLASRAVGTTWDLPGILLPYRLSGVTIFAFGIVPYISAAFIVLVVARIWGFLNRNASTRRDVPVVAATWCLAILLCAIQAIGLARFLERGSPIVANPGWAFRITTLVTLTAGTTGLTLISDQISKRRMGNGMLVVFVAGLVAGLSSAFVPILTGQMDPFALLPMLVLNVVVADVVSHGYHRSLERERLT